MAAIAEPLILTPKPSLKNSISHPINISFMIPPDLVALISSHALLSKPFSPTLLEIPSSFNLHRLSNLRDARQILPPKPATPPTFPTLTMQPSDHFPTRSTITDALHAAINSGSINTSGENKVVDQVRNSFLTGFTPDTSVSLSLSLKGPNPFTFQSAMVSHLPQRPEHTIEPAQLSPLPFWTPEPPTIIPFYSPPPFTIGNLFLSSCPGKKVRLNGPVKGRSGVCRDLETDMKRMKQMGVGCIVCCLDDVELEFLGAPWPEYEQSAKKIGIDILRLPIPEGLPPISAACLDAHLLDLINRYSLRGIPILVHCRGGVGRAGVIACCWMIRLGLCGWFDQKTPASSNFTADGARSQDTIAFVEKVIALVRRRRSMKAIETYEQVEFLVDYVDHLRHGSPQTLLGEFACLL
ncbi:hypothetical protein M413DRAFT_441847 [Hebeloma cylindrosporum]|uniref:Tyrosine specific protein phosphatases domain-containing protein n=1 Tax=Hebeloma cylindrosporum TaxID=76867 RepID=A0A0C3CN30_HEBCY|nr:hypothetical protein M413DRAFT_441847 [Hebeloma cylindrosporum h7]